MDRVSHRHSSSTFSGSAKKQGSGSNLLDAG